jgi:hypothetical protein
MLGGFGRGAAAGAIYGAVAIVALIAGDGEVLHDPAASAVVLLYAGTLAAVVGAACGCLGGAVGGAVLWAARTAGCRGRGLLAAAVVLGAGLGWFMRDLAAAMGSAPDTDSSPQVLLWRVGPAIAGAAGAVWQASRTR